MPTTNWQARRAATRQPYIPKLVVLPATPCGDCGHCRTSHSALVLSHRCRVASCPCTIFNPTCGCGHSLWSHSFGTPPHPWACYQCDCRGFGAKQEMPASATLF